MRRGTVRISVKEGKKHEVRIIAERADLLVLELKRIRIGKLVLGSLQEGEYRQLSDQDKQIALYSIIRYLFFDVDDC